ncbi:2-dehydro-3-deoxygalactonokinase [Thalassotalea nanhaiensis]|uniref:2-dehydro-3-deoxygalactonokinase n=1 Tax=Thalassotalea nanhaiensis TaxID=3065648 RepID=A0ABY9TJV0_9GAMM|nr:2-dehydro-3-deoxygalactonokinase [Colwelliaceae bacterium SQ345]
MASQYLVTIDWGTSFLRAYLCELSKDAELRLIETQVGRGVSKCDGNFEQELLNCISSWIPQYGKLPVYMAGQISSSIGWQNTKYLPCPLAPKDIAFGGKSFSANGHDIYVLPGTSCEYPDQSFDVMRGEELQILGWMQLALAHETGKHILCLPGTHTKWVLVENGTIRLFKTAMTGELFDILSNSSVLIEEPNDNFDSKVFIEGAEYVLQGDAGDFSHDLFSVRTRQIQAQLTKQQATSYLSGILIGTDARAAQQSPYWEFDQVESIHIVGSIKLSKYFATVLGLMGYKSKTYDAKQTSLLGFASILKQRCLTNSTN